MKASELAVMLLELIKTRPELEVCLSSGFGSEKADKDKDFVIVELPGVAPSLVVGKGVKQELIIKFNQPYKRPRLSNFDGGEDESELF